MDPNAEFLKALRSRFNKYLLFAELVGLVVIALAAIVAMLFEVKTMALSHAVTLTDLLLMFLYLEVLAMVGKYVKVGELSVNYPLFIAMVALARELILGNGTSSGVHLLETAGAILLLALGVLLIRVGQVKFPTADDEMLEK